MTALVYIIVGVLLWAFFSRYLKAAAYLFALLIVILFGYRLLAWIVPEIAELNWRGFWSGSAVGLIVAVSLVASFAYVLGWRARVEATEAEDIERAKSKAAKDRKLA